MGCNNNTINHITNNETIKRWFNQQWRILTLFVVFCCNASLPVAASTVSKLVNVSSEIIPHGAGFITTVDISDMAKRSADMLETPQVLRHKEYYSHRIDTSINERKRTKLHQQFSGNYISSIQKDANSNTSNKYIHFQSQLQPKMANHLRHHNHSNNPLDPANTWKPHPRHQHHHQQQQNEQLNKTKPPFSIHDKITPEISQIRSVITEAPLGDALAAKNDLPVQYIIPHRFYDRNGLYDRAKSNGWRRTDFESMRLQNKKEMSSKRITLNLDATSDDETVKHADISNNKTENDGSSGSKYSYDKGSNLEKLDKNDKIFEYDMGSNNEYDDYSYEDSKVEKDGSTNEFPYGGERHPAVKRFTNPFDEIRLPPKHRANPQPYLVTHRRFGKDRANSDDDDSDFSKEKWQRIEQEHHRKQQEHHRQMLALHARHNGKYRPLEAAITTAPAIVSVPTLTVKQQRNIDNDYTDSINSQNYVPGTLTRQKQEELGTLAAVQESRRSHVIKQKHEKALAGEHVKQILSEATCRIPQRRVERIQQDPSKVYMPHCTVLYRCTDEAGCCRSNRQTCAPKQIRNIDLYFYVRSVNEKRGTVERLTFVNHTECHCVERSKLQVDEYQSLSMYGISGDRIYSGESLPRATILNCICPKLYEKILQEDGFCRCDCSSGNTGCDWLKRGMEHFSMIDRKCISDGRCKQPTCEHGNYIQKYGRCPRREEHLSVATTDPLMLATTKLSGNDYHLNNE
ncbi:uncharacterized protein [Eurosta solidaginis]|uniref:uncharacterized protein isoform X2 n=1 Tax=Eurosta solidaginis TaxID=178769 RepID=UPI00353165D4